MEPGIEPEKNYPSRKHKRQGKGAFWKRFPVDAKKPPGKNQVKTYALSNPRRAFQAASLEVNQFPPNKGLEGRNVEKAYVESSTLNKTHFCE